LLQLNQDEKVPYHESSNAACAQHVTQWQLSIFYQTTYYIEQFGKIADWKEGYLVWGFSVWKWMMIKEFTSLTMIRAIFMAMDNEGVDGLSKTISPKEFKYYKDNTYNLKKVTKQLH